MPTLKLLGFDGVVPRQSPTLLANNQAQRADNVKLYSQELRYWRGPTLVYEPDTRPAAIYRLRDGDGNAIWLTWPNVVDVARGPLADVEEKRVYYTGDGVPKKTNYELASTGGPPYPQDWLRMGVPAPETPPSVVLSGDQPQHAVTVNNSVAMNDDLDVDHTANFNAAGPTPGDDTMSFERLGTQINVTLFSYTSVSEDGAVDQSPTPARTFAVPITDSSASSDRVVTEVPTVETRAYVYTYVSSFGSLTEESAPSPASQLLDLYYGQAVAVSGFADPPTDNYNITAIRIYRSVAGETTDSYQFVTEIPVATNSYTDSLTVAQLGEVLSTVGWTPPPDDLSGLVGLPNGALAGFVGNSLHFSEPYAPHAWPSRYTLTFPYDIVAIGTFSNSIVVATEREPFVVTGPFPGAMSVERVPIDEPCVAKTSLVSDEFGVVYASPNGLVSIGYNGRGVVTKNLFRRDEWQQVDPAEFRAVVYDSKYIAARPDITTSALVISRDDVPALSYLALAADAMYVDAEIGELFFVNAEDGKVYEADSDELRPYNYVWRSKRFVLPTAITASALKLDADFSLTGTSETYNALVAEIAAENQVAFASDLEGAMNASALNTYPVNGSILQELPVLATERSVIVSFYVEGETNPVTTLTVSTYDPIRIPPFRAREMEVEIIGNVNVRSLTVATSVGELRG